METPIENTVPTSATSDIGSEADSMSRNDFQKEKLYQATMSMARKMLHDGLISEEEYRQVDTIFLEKYQPGFGTLFSDLSLTSRA